MSDLDGSPDYWVFVSRLIYEFIANTDSHAGANTLNDIDGMITNLYQRQCGKCDFIQNCVYDCQKRRLRCQKGTCWQSRTFQINVLRRHFGNPKRIFMVIYNSFCQYPFYLFAIAANTVRLLLCSEWRLDTVVGVRTLFIFMRGRYSYPPPELHGSETSVRWTGLCRIEDRYPDMWNQPLPRYISKLFSLNVSNTI